MEQDLLAPDEIVRSLHLRRVRVSLHTPYRLSYRTFDEFEPFLVEARNADGRLGLGEAHISPGSSKETREGGWAFCTEMMPGLPGLPVAEARARVLAEAHRSPAAASAIVTALEMLGQHRALTTTHTVRHALLAPMAATEPDAIAAEMERWVEQGYPTLKVKVGKDVQADLARVRHIQDCARSRVTLRLDANRGFDRAQALAFVRGLDPEGIELFEQPCPTDAWDDNAAVAAASPVPLMLDEPICSLADIARAGDIPNVRFCKVKLKRFSGLGRLIAALEAVRAHGMGAVLGDGLGADLSGWMEAMAGEGRIYGAGEFNGFQKLNEGLLAEALPARGPNIEIPAGFVPRLDPASVARRTEAEFSA
ncbi:mandelate racemase/muconate lactonizing enzyme family protein [Roseomonas chloroacetimidivorans]|uniref:mandelate racemase/muconate lactonizing enzyme family protein n=1 Tax=Roseomonas chloroacetimidivorans TaxID=1766656 RepID=UPI003C70ECD4